MILITGSLAFDQILDFPGKFSDHIMADKLHMLNVSFLVENMRKGFGGTAGNIAYSLSLLGVKTAIMATVGEDFSLYRDFLNRCGIDVSKIKALPNQYTATAIGFTDSSDNQIWGFHTGADSYSDKLSVADYKGKIGFGIIAPQNPKTMLKFAREYTAKKIPYLFDPGMQLPYFSSEDLKGAFIGAKIIIGNDYEVSVMEKKTGISDLHEMAKDGKVIITTLAEEGSLVSYGNDRKSIKPAKPLNVDDPAGAGDAYRAGFIAGFLKGFSIKVCGGMGSVAAVYTVEKYGTTTHYYTTADFEKRYEENYGEKLKL